MADAERIPIHQRARNGQGLEAQHTALRQKPQDLDDQGDTAGSPAHLRVRTVPRLARSKYWISLMVIDFTETILCGFSDQMK